MSDYGIPKQVTLGTDQVIFKKGHRVDGILISNNTSANRLIDVAAYNTSFYFPENVYNHAGREEVFAPSYFYMVVPANDMRERKVEFFARRGLVIKGQGANGSKVYAAVTVSGVTEGGLLTGRE